MLACDLRWLVIGWVRTRLVMGLSSFEVGFILVVPLVALCDLEATMTC